MFEERVPSFNTLVHDESTLAYGLPFPKKNEHNNLNENIEQDDYSAIAQQY